MFKIVGVGDATQLHFTSSLATRNQMLPRSPCKQTLPPSRLSAEEETQKSTQNRQAFNLLWILAESLGHSYRDQKRLKPNVIHCLSTE